MKKQNLTSKVFGRLHVIGLAPDTLWQSRHPAYFCICECGEFLLVRGSNLQTNNSRSCGCARARHGHAVEKTPTYRSWRAMRRRCSNDLYYMGKGITVCDRWLNSFDSFLSDMGIRPEGTTLDRINNDGNYEPENCRWATYKEQANNRHQANQWTKNAQQDRDEEDS